MRRVVLADGADIDGFRAALRSLWAARVAPQDVVWSSEAAPDLFGASEIGAAPPVSLPRDVAYLVTLVVCHRDPERYALLYTLVWRILSGERALMEVQSDPLVHRLGMMAKSVRRDLHKMHAFVRFRVVVTPEGERCVAWFEPEHFILRRVADFFVGRFAALVWSILSPIGSLHWDGEKLLIGPPGSRGDAPDEDAFEAAWRGYYESTFNPARVNPTLMRQHMPKKYWRNLPETQAIPSLIQNAASRVDRMIAGEPSMPVKRNPEKAVAKMAAQTPTSLKALNRIIAASEPLVPGATQAVLGEGPLHAPIAFVGEQPGDVEDEQGRPFVGPAGQLLMRAMAEAGIERERSYLTNAVKHFKFERRGKKRIHQTPTVGEVKHYKWWLDLELDFVEPGIVVALGATATLALAGKAIPITKNRGPATFGERRGFITVHPSYLLRLPDESTKREAYAAFVADLKRVKTLSKKAAAAA